MKIRRILFVLLISSSFSAFGQSRFQVAVSGGPTFTPDTEFRNCIGHIDKAFTGSLALLYRINSSFGVEMKFSALANPTAYLENGTDNTLKAYTISKIVFQRILAGFNYYVPLKGVHPFIGVVAGASYAQANASIAYSSTYSFNAGFQTGVIVNIAKSIALRLDGSALFIPGVSNSSSYFNTGAYFPFFILGNPSSASIRQYNVNLGVLIAIRKSRK